MAEVLANVIPLTDSTCKLKFIGFDAPKSAGLTSITFDEVDYDVLDDGNTNNSYVVVDASYSVFNASRVIISADVPEPTPSIPLGYGLLYNWYAATDERGVAPSGFRVPDSADVDAMISEVGSSSNNTLRGVRSIGSDLNNPVNNPGWLDSNLGSDDFEFAFYAYGVRLDTGVYKIEYTSATDQQGRLLTTSIQGSEPFEFYTSYIFATSLTDVQKSTFGGALKTFGASIRCVSDTEPSTPTVTDNDGNEYTWVQIGSQYWLAQNMKTTTYNNGDVIPTGLDNTSWAATTDGAYALPNGDPSLPI